MQNCSDLPHGHIQSLEPLPRPHVYCPASFSPHMQRLVWTAHALQRPPSQLDTKTRHSSRASLWALASIPPWGPSR